MHDVIFRASTGTPGASSIPQFDIIYIRVTLLLHFYLFTYDLRTAFATDDVDARCEVIDRDGRGIQVAQGAQGTAGDVVDRHFAECIDRRDVDPSGGTVVEDDVALGDDFIRRGDGAVQEVGP